MTISTSITEAELGYDVNVIASPCTNVCLLDAASGLCRGCLRTLDEIAGWAAFGDAERRTALRRVERRRAAAIVG